MHRWTRSDGTAVLAICAGAAVGATLLPTPFPAATRPPEARTALVDPTPRSSTAALPTDAIAFHASSVGMGWGVEGDYAGALALVDGALRATLPFAVLRANAGAGVTVDAPTEHVRGVRLALAEDGPSGWRVVREGPLHPVGASIDPGTRLAVQGLVLTLPDVAEEDLVGRWLVIVHELDTPGADGVTPAWTYAHAEMELLPRLLGWVEDGC